jgi:hypothetical protein
LLCEVLCGVPGGEWQLLWAGPQVPAPADGTGCLSIDPLFPLNYGIGSIRSVDITR